MAETADDLFVVQDREFRLGQNIVYQDEEFTMIRHPRPLSKHHYVVAPKHPKMVVLKDLDQHHAGMLRRMANVMKKGLREYGPSHTKFRIGFPAGLNIFRVHLHAISEDLSGRFLSSAEHWNAVSTDYFVKADKVIADIESRGRVTLPDERELMNLLNQNMKCHRCDATFEYFDDLRNHINDHHHHRKKEQKPPGGPISPRDRQMMRRTEIAKSRKKMTKKTSELDAKKQPVPRLDEARKKPPSKKN